MNTFDILHVTSAHPPHDVRVWHKEVQFLHKAFDGRVGLLFATQKSKLKSLKLEEHHIPVPLVMNSRFDRMYQAVNAIFYELNKLKPKLVHIHDPELLRIVKPLTKKGIQVVYDVHEDVPRQVMAKGWIPKFLRARVSSYVERLENKALKYLSGVVCATPTIADRFMHLHENVVIAKNYPIKAEAKEFIKDYMPKKGFVYTGGISATRGAKFAIEAWEKVNCEEKMVFAGNFSPKNFRYEMAKVKAWKSVDYRGFVGRKELVEIQSQALAGLVVLSATPNHVNALPIKLFEYMAAGTAVIASDFPLWKSIVEEYDCGYVVEADNAEKLAEVMQYVLDHPQEVKEKGKNGMKAIEADVNWETEVQQIIQLYNKIL